MQTCNVWEILEVKCSAIYRIKLRALSHKVAGSRPTCSKQSPLGSWVRHLTYLTFILFYFILALPIAYFLFISLLIIFYLDYLLLCVYGFCGNMSNKVLWNWIEMRSNVLSMFKRSCSICRKASNKWIILLSNKQKLKQLLGVQ